MFLYRWQWTQLDFYDHILVVMIFSSLSCDTDKWDVYLVDATVMDVDE